MFRRILILIVLAIFVVAFIPLILNFNEATDLQGVAYKYVKDGPTDLGAPNLVTSIVVTYRGLDTLGEVTVLFLATAGVGFLLRRNKGSKDKKKRKSSEILQVGTAFLFPIIVLFGVYIFVHGHLTPGGGFQGGVVIATAFLLVLLANPQHHFNHTLLGITESFSGFFYVFLALLGLFLAAGFVDTTYLPLGKFGHLFSAGAIPLIYSFVGLKVGSELISILDSMKKD